MQGQAPILARLTSEPQFRELITFHIDFNTQKDVLRKFKVSMQSTMIVFRG